MDADEIRHRDNVLRAYFNGRNWDKNNEYALKRQLVLKNHQLLPDYPYVIEDEWEVELGRSDKGRGDLVFTNGNSSFAVVEVKWIDLEGMGRTGSTKRTSNNKKRRVVEKQAVKYANPYSQRQRDVLSVESFIFTNECDEPRPCSQQSSSEEDT